MDKKLIGEYLEAERLINENQLRKALETQASMLNGGTAPLLGTILVQMGAVSEQDVTFALEKQERDRMRM